MSPGESVWFCLLMCEAGLTVSNGPARRLDKQEVLSLTMRELSNADMENEPSEEVIIQVGRRRFVHVNFT